MSILRLCLLLCGLLLPWSLSAGDDPTREALQELEAPWYDAEDDSWRRIPERLPRWQTAGGGAAVTGFGWFFVVLVAGVLVWLLVILIRGRVTGDRHERPVRAAASEGLGADLADLPMATDRIRDPASALRAARERGDWPQAVVWLYALQLLLLDRHRLIRLRRGATNGSYLHSVQASGRRSVARVLQQSIRVFEQVHFGGRPCSEATFRELETAHEELVAELPAEATV